MIRERSISTVSQPSMMSSSYSSSMSRKTSSYRQTKNMSSRSEKEFLVEKIINFTNKECSDKVKSKLRVEDESNIRTLINNIFKASKNNPDIKKYMMILKMRLQIILILTLLQNIHKYLIN